MGYRLQQLLSYYHLRNRENHGIRWRWQLQLGANSLVSETWVCAVLHDDSSSSLQHWVLCQFIAKCSKGHVLFSAPYDYLYVCACHTSRAISYCSLSLSVCPHLFTYNDIVLPCIRFSACMHPTTYLALIPSSRWVGRILIGISSPYDKHSSLSYGSSWISYKTILSHNDTK